MKLVLLMTTLTFAGATLGMDCGPFARPWMVRFSSGESGVLINEWWVLAQGDYDGNHEGVSARLGVDDLTGHSDGEQQIAVAIWINHEPYRRPKRSPVHDLAMVRLAQPASLTPQVQPAPLPTQCAQAGEVCVATSFASTSGSGKQQCLVQKMLSDSVCERLPWYSPYMTCTGPHPSSGGHCMTDGSMLMCGGILQGVEGFGWMSDGCSHGKPDTYAKICKYRHWIDSVMSSVTPPPTTPPPPAPSESPFTLPPGFETTTTTPWWGRSNRKQKHVK